MPHYKIESLNEFLSRTNENQFSPAHLMDTESLTLLISEITALEEDDSVTLSSGDLVEVRGDKYLIDDSEFPDKFSLLAYILGIDAGQPR